MVNLILRIELFGRAEVGFFTEGLSARGMPFMPQSDSCLYGMLVAKLDHEGVITSAECLHRICIGNGDNS